MVSYSVAFAAYEKLRRACVMTREPWHNAIERIAIGHDKILAQDTIDDYVLRITLKGVPSSTPPKEYESVPIAYCSTPKPKS